jgi:hypothetical protein
MKMKKTFTLLLGFLLVGLFADGQTPGEWTWMNGDSAANSAGHYGTQGFFDTLNTPPSAYEACEWTDKNGNFWLYGARGYSNLWEFKPSINQWAWIKGPGAVSQPPNYGIQGIPSPTNSPGYRSLGVPTWVDTTGNLWLFGGMDYTGSGYKSDLWKYNISTNEWTWINGSTLSNQPGVYGIMGVPNLNNHPGGRMETNATWTDDDNNLWIYGGLGFGDSSTAFSTHSGIADLWKYNISTNEWAWMNGSTVFGQAPVYGTKGIPSINNTPGGRLCYAKWKGNNNDLWLFGGKYWYSGWGSYPLNDLWKYDMTTNEWTWVSGDSTLADTISISSGQCVSNVLDIPSIRFENRACWNLGGHDFITFGGGWASFAVCGFNDLWDYNVASNEWTLLKGSVTPFSHGVYGTKYVSDILNTPCGRIGSVAWMDDICNLWLFGGYDSSGATNNDMWRYHLDNSCPFAINCESGTAFINTSNKPIRVLSYPNPTTSIITLQSTNPLSTITIYSTDGRKLQEEYFSSHSEKVQLNLSGLAAGVYFMECVGQEGSDSHAERSRSMVKVVKY